MKSVFIKFVFCLCIIGAFSSCNHRNSNYTVKNVNKVMEHYGFVNENLNDILDETNISTLPEKSIRFIKEITYKKGGQTFQVVLINFQDAQVALSNESLLLIEDIREEKKEEDMLVRGTTGGDTAIIFATPQQNTELMNTLYKQFTTELDNFLYR